MLPHFLKIFLFIFLSLALQMTFAAPLETPRFEKLDDSVLGGRLVQAFVQDKQGFIWMGTRDGLFRFDGHHAIGFRYLPNNPKSLPSNNIVSLFEDLDGRIWVGTSDGLARFNPQTNDFTTFEPKNGIEQYRFIRAIASDKHEGMWVATRGGLQHFFPRTGEFIQYLHDANDENSIKLNNINAITVDEQGGVWAGMWLNGLDYLPFGEKKFQHFRIDSETKNDLQLNSPTSLLVDKKGRLWMGTEGNIVVWQIGTDWNTRKILPKSAEFNPRRIFSILEDQDGAIWLGSISEGLARWNDEKNEFIAYKHRPVNSDSGASAQDIWTFLQDKQGILWISSISEGVTRLNLSSKGFSVLQEFGNGTNSSKNITSVVGEDDSHIWVAGYSGGVHLVDLTTRKTIKTLHPDINLKNTLGNDVVYSLYRDKKSALWIGTKTGLYRFDIAKNTFQHISFGTGSGDYINKIAPSKNEKLWLVTGNGTIVHYDTLTDKRESYFYEPKNPQGHQHFRTSDILEDSKERVWLVNSDGGGLEKLDIETGIFEHYRYQENNFNSVGDDKIARLHEDKNGTIWTATNSGFDKITTLENGSLQFRSYGKKDNLAFDSVELIHSDATGKIWLSTNLGISEFDPQTEQFVHYSQTDGITGGLTSGLSNSYSDKQGRVFFGSSRGVTIVDTKIVKVSLAQPPVAITDITIFNKSLRTDNSYGKNVKIDGSLFEPKSLTLSWKESVFGLEFSALQFDSPNLVRYAYRLEGFDNNWIETNATHRIASYTNLPAGKYVFRVKAASSKGVWNESGAVLPILITPAFWQTLWFRVVTLVLFVLALAFVYFWRVRQLTLIQEQLEKQVQIRTKELQKMHQKALEETETKSRFLANMSHEIRTPMNAISGLSYLALQKENVPLGIRDYLEKIHRSATSLMNILNDILDFSKLESGHLTLEYQPYSLNAVALHLNDLFADLAKEKDLLFKIHIASDVPRDLIGDKFRIQQILTNLVGNALKFTEQGCVSLDICLQKMESSTARLLFSVTDTGIGLSEQDKTKLFQPFSQVDGSITRRFGGTGLGLTISYNLLQMMGGQFFVESSIGKGSTFSFELTQAIASISKQEIIENKQNNSQSLRGTRILVAEDNEINQQITREMLTNVGVVVMIANNGKDALEILAQHHFDAVLMDMSMPVMDGFEATRQIRANPRYANLPVIALSGGVTAEEQAKCALAGTNAFIAKPLDPKQLISMLAFFVGKVIENQTAQTVTVPSRLKNLAGFDIKNFLASLNQNYELATRLLLTFSAKFKNAANEIETLLAQNETEAAQNLIHNVKGSAGSIGAVELYRVTKDLEKQIDEPNLLAFKRELETTLETIATLSPFNEMVLGNSGDMQALAEIILEFKRLLSSNHFINESMITQLQKHLPYSQYEWFMQFRESLDHLDYKNALKLLKKLSETET